MSLKWIAPQVEMGGWTCVSDPLAARRKKEIVNSEDFSDTCLSKLCLLMKLNQPLLAFLIRVTI